jgi:hypothetical protein
VTLTEKWKTFNNYNQQTSKNNPILELNPISRSLQKNPAEIATTAIK